MHYIPLKLELTEPVAGIPSAMRAMRLPKDQTAKKQTDHELSSNLIKGGPDHAKCMRGIVAYVELKGQAGWLIEYMTYRIGLRELRDEVECLSSSSSMHNELAELRGVELAEQKQIDLVDKVYTRIDMISYQTMRWIYKSRRHHKHPDWQTFCDFIETLPNFTEFIMPKKV